MKKTVALAFAVTFALLTLTCCSSNNSASTDILNSITFEQIAKVNSRNNLLKSHKYISETTANVNTSTNNNIIWILSYEKVDDNINAIIDIGEQYKCYYFNNKVCAAYDNRISPVLTFRETYEGIIKDILKRDNTLNCVYNTVSSRKLTEDDGYEISYDFKSTPELNEDFSDWNVAPGQKMRITYTLNSKLEILKYVYYILESDNTEKQIVTISFKYDTPITFPDEVVNLYKDVRLCKVTLFENYSMGSQYSETYDVPYGCTVEMNSNLYAYNIYKEPENVNLWNFQNDVVNKDTNLYLSQNVEIVTDDTVTPNTILNLQGRTGNNNE